VAFVFLVAFVCSSCAGLERASNAAAPPIERRYEFSEPYMGTTVRVVLYSRNQGEARVTADAAFARVAELDRTLSDYRADSELSRVTRGPVGRPISVGQDLLAVLQSAQDLAVRSDGAFDITVGPLARLWRRARRQVEFPAAEELAAARAVTGYRLLSVDARARTVTIAKAGMALDPGGIAKGYAADAALAVLRGAGHGSALVAVGGDIAAGAAPPGTRGWEVAITGLGPADVAPSSPLTIANAGVSTSGDAEQWVEIDGRRYSHVVDPLTGIGITGRRTVTVLAPDAMTSDMLATALSVMAVEAGLTLADSTPGAAAQIGVAGDSGVSWRRSRAWTY
jgi:thiamine biosynthesis lipoprotein